MIKTIKAKEGLKLGDSYMNNDIRELVAKNLQEEDGSQINWDLEQYYEQADELITLIRTATLDEVKEAVSQIEEDPIQNEDDFISGKYKAINAIDNLRGER